MKIDEAMKSAMGKEGSADVVRPHTEDGWYVELYEGVLYWFSPSGKAFPVPYVAILKSDWSVRVDAKKSVAETYFHNISGVSGDRVADAVKFLLQKVIDAEK